MPPRLSCNGWLERSWQIAKQRSRIKRTSSSVFNLLIADLVYLSLYRAPL